MRLLPILALTSCLAQPLAAGICGIEAAAVEARIAELEGRYGLMLSDIGCDLPTIPAHVLMCDATNTPETWPLWRMGRLDDLAWVYAVENATGQEVDLINPPRDESFLAARDACTDEACLCQVLIEHTNGSLGGTSPYPQ
jgi:hypothetical protein